MSTPSDPPQSPASAAQSSDQPAPDQPDIAAIMALLASRLDLDVTHLELSAERGRVTVSGAVPLRRMLHQVETLVAAQPGVTAVDMQLEAITRDFTREQRQPPDAPYSTGIIDDDRDRQTGHEL